MKHRNFTHITHNIYTSYQLELGINIEYRQHDIILSINFGKGYIIVFIVIGNTNIILQCAYNVYKKIHRNPLCPTSRNDINGISDNSVADGSEFELSCR